MTIDIQMAVLQLDMAPHITPRANARDADPVLLEQR